MIRAEEIMTETKDRLLPRLPRFYVPAWDMDVLTVSIIDLLPGNMVLVEIEPYSDGYIGTRFTISLKHLFKTRRAAHRSRKRWEKSIQKRQKNKKSDNLKV